MNHQARSTGGKATKGELKELAEWQAETPGAAAFEGGGTANALWIGIAILCVAVIAIYTWIIEPGRNRP